MSEPTSARSPFLAFAWLLLVIPAGLGAGWAIGQLPVPEPSVTPEMAPPSDRTVATVSDAHEPAPLAATGDGVQTVEVQVGGAGPDGSTPAPEPVRPSEPPARDELSQWTTFDLAVAESRRTGKPVMIDFNADWCPPCRRMKQEVFDHGAHAATVQTAVIPVSIVDRAREEGRNPSEIEDLQRRYGIEAFPTLIVFSPATGRVERARGYGGSDRTVDWIRWAARSVR